MQTARSRWSAASERKKQSMGRRRPRGASGSMRCRRAADQGDVLVGRHDVDAARAAPPCRPRPRRPASACTARRGRAAGSCGRGRGAARARTPCRGGSAGQRGEELLDGGEAAGGGADADDREVRRRGGTLGGGAPGGLLRGLGRRRRHARPPACGRMAYPLQACACWSSSEAPNHRQVTAPLTDHHTSGADFDAAVREARRSGARSRPSAPADGAPVLALASRRRSTRWPPRRRPRAARAGAHLII